MLSFLETTAAWVAEQTGDESLQITHREGARTAPKRSAAVGFESRAALGSFAVWETGEVEAEVLIVDTLERPLVVSVVAQVEEDVTKILDRVMATMRQI